MSTHKLPVGAIDIADPLDVVRATKARQKSHILSAATDGKMTKKDKTAKTRLRRQYEAEGVAPLVTSAKRDTKQTRMRPRRTSFYRSSSSSSQSSSDEEFEAFSNVDTAAASKLKLSRKKKVNSRRRDEGDAANRMGKKSDGRGAHGTAEQGSVPIEVQDTRYELERRIDEVIDAVPTLRELSTFAAGSIPDYIDKLGVTRDEAFAKFPRDKPNLPKVPGSTEVPVLNVLKAAGQDEEAHGSRENLLREALDLECRRADLLEYQVKMLRGELVSALKRMNVLSTVFKLNVENADDDSDRNELRRMAQQEGVQEALGEIRALRSGKVLKVLPVEQRERESKRPQRKGHWSARWEGGDSSSSSSGSEVL